MSTKGYSINNLHFMLYEVFEVSALTEHDYFSKHNQESFNIMLDVAEDIAEKFMRPYYRDSDKNPPELVDGKVKVHPALHKYHKAFSTSGLLSSSFDEQFGGSQVPKTVYAAADFIVGNAHNGFEMFTGLGVGAANLIVSFASRDLIDRYVSKILSGNWAATMCLTEPQAGSALSNITTNATPLDDATFKIKGQKIFISAGDHDITDNIVHLVLGRIEGAPSGIKGVSLFLVPLKRDDSNGLLTSNDVLSVGIYHKMGQRSTPAMHLDFGSNDACVGYLIGEAGQGLSYMFQMMNTARLGVGLAGSYIASSAYYASLQYAKERPQGKRLNARDVIGPQVPIINHPDVRRMLFLQKAIVEGSLSLVLQCYLYEDLLNICDAQEEQRYRDLLELLTPVAKTYGAEMGCVSVNAGLQVLGGYGYTEDFPLEQLARDIRIMSLYEGTTGIQSQALLGRQVISNKCRSLGLFIEEVSKVIVDAKQVSELASYGDWLLKEVQALDRTTEHLLNINANGDREVFLSDANLYMELFGHVCIGWQWLKQSIVAFRCNKNAGLNEETRVFYRSKIETMRFFFHYELRKTNGLHERLRDEKVITVINGEEILV